MIGLAQSGMTMLCRFAEWGCTNRRGRVILWIVGKPTEQAAPDDFAHPKSEPNTRRFYVGNPLIEC